MIPKSLDTLRIDINSGKVRKAVSICQQDTVHRTLNFLLVNSGNSVDLSNVLFAEILIHKADGAEADNGCVIDGDSIQYTLRTTDVSALGTNQAQLLLTFADGQTLTTPTFEINVYSKVLNQNVQKSQNEYRALTEQLVLVNEMSNQIGTARDTAIAKATEAKASAVAAAESATSANAAKDDVAASATVAANSASAAAQSALDALNTSAAIEQTCQEYVSEVNAGIATAQGYANNASASADAAAQSVQDATDIAEGIEESCVGYVTSAQNAATTAADYASNASSSASAAAQSATSSAAKATEAAISATDAATSENNALGYAERAEEAYRKMGEEGLVLGETSSTAYRGDRGKIAYNHSQTTGNPHNTTAAQVGADVAGAAAQAYQQASGYTDTQIANLINGAPSTLDTLKEIADAMAEHEEVVEALDQAIGTKASDVEFQAHQNNTTVHITANERTNWNNAVTNIGNTDISTIGDGTLSGAAKYLNDSFSQALTDLKDTAIAKAVGAVGTTFASVISKLGEIVNRGAWSANMASTGSVTIPQGYHDGTGTVKTNGTANITSNGTHNVAQHSSASVNVHNTPVVLVHQKYGVPGNQRPSMNWGTNHGANVIYIVELFFAARQYNTNEGWTSAPTVYTDGTWIDSYYEQQKDEVYTAKAHYVIRGGTYINIVTGTYASQNWDVFATLLLI
ncbi:BppU family phage baseplate upper protein [Pseudobutyrivibrio sp.]